MEKELKERVRIALAEYSYNPTNLANKYGVNQKTLNNQINGETQMSVSTILLILDAIPEISAEWLLRGIGTKTKAESQMCDNAYYEMCNKILEVKSKETELYQQLAHMMSKE